MKKNISANMVKALATGLAITIGTSTTIIGAEMENETQNIQKNQQEILSKEKNTTLQTAEIEKGDSTKIVLTFPKDTKLIYNGDINAMLSAFTVTAYKNGNIDNDKYKPTKLEIQDGNMAQASITISVPDMRGATEIIRVSYNESKISGANNIKIEEQNGTQTPFNLYEQLVINKNNTDAINFEKIRYNETNKSIEIDVDCELQGVIMDGESGGFSIQKPNNAPTDYIPNIVKIDIEKGGKTIFLLLEKLLEEPIGADGDYIIKYDQTTDILKNSGGETQVNENNINSITMKDTIKPVLESTSYDYKTNEIVLNFREELLNNSKLLKDDFNIKSQDGLLLNIADIPPKINGKEIRLKIDNPLNIIEKAIYIVKYIVPTDINNKIKDKAPSGNTAEEFTGNNTFMVDRTPPAAKGEYYVEYIAGKNNDKIILHFDEEITEVSPFVAGDINGEGIFARNDENNINNIIPKAGDDKKSIVIELGGTINKEFTKFDKISLKANKVQDSNGNTNIKTGYATPIQYDKYNESVRAEYETGAKSGETNIIMSENAIGDAIMQKGSPNIDDFIVMGAKEKADGTILEYKPQKILSVDFIDEKESINGAGTVNIVVQGEWKNLKLSYVPSVENDDSLQILTQSKKYKEDLIIKDIEVTKVKKPTLSNPVYNNKKKTITLDSSKRLIPINVNNSNGFKITGNNKNINITNVKVNAKNKRKLVLSLSDSIPSGNYEISYNVGNNTPIKAQNKQELANMNGLKLKVDISGPIILDAIRFDNNKIGLVIDEKLKDNINANDIKAFSVEDSYKNAIEINDIMVLPYGLGDVLVLTIDEKIMFGKYYISYDKSLSNIMDMAGNRLEDAKATLNVEEKGTISDVEILGEASTQLENYEIRIALENDGFMDMKEGINVDDWFKNLPDGLSAKTKTAINNGDKSAIIEINGIPKTKRNIDENIQIEIPKDNLVKNISMKVSPNDNARFIINKANVLAPEYTKITNINTNDNTIMLELHMNGGIDIWSDKKNATLEINGEEPIEGYIELGKKTTKGYFIKKAKKSSSQNNIIEIILQKDAEINKNDTIKIYSKSIKDKDTKTLTDEKDKLGYKKMTDYTSLVNLTDGMIFMESSQSIIDNKISGKRGYVIPTKEQENNTPTDNDKELTLDDINLPPILDTGKTFIDIYPKFWAMEHIDKLSRAKIVEGMGYKFMPSRAIKRADSVIMIVKLLGLDSNDRDVFLNIDKNLYYEKYVSIAKKYNIIKGYENEFRPEDKITRQEMMTIIGDILKRLGVGIDEDKSILDKFNDSDNISQYAREYVAILVNNGMILGEDGNINPKKYITRAEMSTIMSKLYDILDKEVKNR